MIAWDLRTLDSLNAINKSDADQVQSSKKGSKRARVKPWSLRRREAEKKMQKEAVANARMAFV
jgi:hypothetical protein